MFGSLRAFRSSTACLLLFISCLSPISCGRLSRSSLAIYGGRAVVAHDWDNVVAISDSEGLYCSGTALTPTLVVTAAHCVSEERLDDVRIYAGAGEEGRDARGQYTIKKMGFSPRFNPSNPDSSFDVGYMVLSEPLKIPNAAYVKVLMDAQEIKELIVKGKMATLVGYGAREDDGYGLKFEVESPLRKVLANEVKIGSDGKDACQGDSGGPAFAQLKSGEWRIFGITSRGVDCGNGGFWELLHRNICWVQKDSKVDLGLPKGSCGQ